MQDAVQSLAHQAAQAHAVVAAADAAVRSATVKAATDPATWDGGRTTPPPTTPGDASDDGGGRAAWPPPGQPKPIITTTTTAPPTTTTTAPPTPPPPPPPSTKAQIAVAYAYSQLGKPYAFATAGPDTFDCSGLTMAAWRAAGVSMPHYSGSQALLFPRVTFDQLRPGDLVFFYTDLHHVGIYIGNGQMIHAPQTGDVVKIAPAWRTTFQWGVRPG
jgi:cell wall-associated NlpC family hydrolase